MAEAQHLRARSGRATKRRLGHLRGRTATTRTSANRADEGYSVAGWLGRAIQIDARVCRNALQRLAGAENARTVQGELERAIADVTGTREFELYGSGRTDAGVHALAQVAHLDLTTSAPPGTLMRRINDELPSDILDIQKCMAHLPCAPQRARTDLHLSGGAPTDCLREAVRLVGQG